MNIKEVVKEINAMPQMKGFEFSKENSDSDSASAFQKVEAKQFKDSTKNEFILGNNYHLFVAHMYAGVKGKEFFYVLLYRKSLKRIFRKRNFFEVEFNKLFASGNSVTNVVENLKNQFKNGYQLI